MTPEQLLMERAEKRRQRRARRMAMLEQYGGGVTQRDLDAELKQHDIAQATQDVAKAEDEGFWDTVGGGVMKLIENSPLAGAQETVAGLASLPAEGLGRLLGTPRAEFDESMEWDETLLNLNPFGLMFNMIGVGTHDSALRTRGREMNRKVGEELALADLNLKQATGISPMNILNPASNPWIAQAALGPVVSNTDLGEAAVKWLSDDANNAAMYEMGFAAATDPLNLIDGGGGAIRPTRGIAEAYQAVKASKVGQRLIEKYPRLALLPEKAWLRINGKAKEARTLGDPRSEALYVAQEIDDSAIGREALKIKQEILEGEAAIFSKLTPDEKVKVNELLPLVREPKKPAMFKDLPDRRYRELLAGMETPDEKLQRALVDAAELYDDAALKDVALRTRFGLEAAELTGPYDYLGREFSDEYKQWLTRNPEASKELLGVRFKAGEQATENALLHFEKTRKLKDFDFAESEKLVRESMRARGLPDNIPIWSRDHLANMANRFDKLPPAIKQRRLMANFANQFGVQNPMITPQLAGEFARELANARHTRAMVRELEAALEASDLRGTQAGFREGREAVRSTAGHWRELAPGEVLEPGAKIQMDVTTGKSRVWVPGEAEAAVSRPVANIINKAVNAADKKFMEAVRKADNADPATWSPEIKAATVEAALAKHGIIPPPQHMTMLDAIRQAKLALPDSFDELAKLATTTISAEDARWFRRYSDDFYRASRLTNHQVLNTLGDYYDRITNIFRRALLASPKSVVKDLQGTFTQGLFPALANPRHIGELTGAAKDLGGTPLKWAQGIGKGYHAPDDVLRMQAEGTLFNIVTDTNVPVSQMPTTAIGKAFEHVEQRGVLASLAKLPGVVGSKVPGKVGKLVAKTSEKAAEFIGKATDAGLHTRQWFEQVQRVALHRAARARGLSWDEATEEVFRYFGKFGETTRLNRATLKRGLLFSEWWIRSLPISVRMLLDHPVMSRTMLYAMAGNTHDDPTMPEWQRRQGGWALGTDEAGNVKTVSLGGGTYLGPTFSILQSDMTRMFMQGDIEAGAAEAAKNVARSAPPLIQMPVERITERDYFTQKDWYANPREKTGNQVQAPMGFYWFTNIPNRVPGEKYEPTAIESLLELEVKTDKNGEVRYMTMSPKWSWLFGGVPGSDPVMQDLSAFVDPRANDAPFGEGGPVLSLSKGAMRQMGMPMYNIPVEPKQVQQVKDLRKALRKEADALSGGTLTITEFGDIVPDKRSPNGRDLADVIAKTTADGKAMGLRGVKLKQYVELKLTRQFGDAWRIMEMDRRLRLLEDFHADKANAK